MSALRDSGGGTTFFIPGTIDNVAGAITATADSLIGAISGVNGVGTLASIQFNALALATTDVTLSNVLLLIFCRSAETVEMI